MIEALHGETIGVLFVEAAGYLADPQLIEPLEQLLADWDDESELITEAIARCRGEIRPRRIWDYVAANEIDQ